VAGGPDAGFAVDVVGYGDGDVLHAGLLL
jgi:hypothetical protein